MRVAGDYRWKDAKKKCIVESFLGIFSDSDLFLNGFGILNHLEEKSAPMYLPKMTANFSTAQNSKWLPKWLAPPISK